LTDEIQKRQPLDLLGFLLPVAFCTQHVSLRAVSVMDYMRAKRENVAERDGGNKQGGIGAAKNHLKRWLIVRVQSVTSLLKD
jgi:hypothetical protein